MILNAIAVCRRPSDQILNLLNEYIKRLPRDFSLKFSYLPPSANNHNSNLRRAEEGARILKRIPKNSYMISLDSKGKDMSSALLAKRFGFLRDKQKKITLVIGGADGLDESVSTKSDECWSLSHLTFPHRFVQIILAEQVYRAWSILEGLPYHRA